MNVTNRCNLECKHCYVNSSPSGEFGQEEHVWLKLVDEIMDAYPNSTLAISGGEPLLRVRLVAKILERSKGNLLPFILTNGHYFNTRFFDRVAIHSPRLRISIDGGSHEAHDFIRGNGSFDKTVKGIQALKDHGYDMSKVEVFCTVQPDREAELFDILELCDLMSINTVKAEPIAKTGRATTFWPKRNMGEYNDVDHSSFLEFFDTEDIAGWKVMDINDMGFSTLTVYANGDVYPYVYYDDRDKKSALLGNIKENHLSEIVDEKKVHHAIVSKIFTAYKGGRRGLESKLIKRDMDFE